MVKLYHDIYITVRPEIIPHNGTVESEGADIPFPAEFPYDFFRQGDMRVSDMDPGLLHVTHVVLCFHLTWFFVQGIISWAITAASGPFFFITGTRDARVAQW